jgi:hypothetical protein
MDRWDAILIALLLAGCSSAPMASQTEPDRPSPPFSSADIGPSIQTNGTVLSTTIPEATLALLPAELRQPALGESLVNCLEVYAPNDSMDLFVAEVSLHLEWTTDTLGTDTLRITAGNNSRLSATAVGQSPLWLNMTGNDSWAPTLPLQIEVRPVFTDATILQEATLNVAGRTYKPRDIALRQAECLTREEG